MAAQPLLPRSAQLPPSKQDTRQGLQQRSPKAGWHLAMLSMHSQAALSSAEKACPQLAGSSLAMLGSAKHSPARLWALPSHLRCRGAMQTSCSGTTLQPWALRLLRAQGQLPTQPSWAHQYSTHLLCPVTGSPDNSTSRKDPTHCTLIARSAFIKHSTLKRQ